MGSGMAGTDKKGVCLVNVNSVRTSGASISGIVPVSLDRDGGDAIAVESERGDEASVESRPGEASYSATDLVQSLRLVGLRSGDIVFFQVSHITLGREESGLSGDALYESILSSISDVIGPQGTMLLPAFSLSFCRNEDFDPQATSAVPGGWSSSLEFLEFVRRRPGVVRSVDAILSVAGLGPQAEQLLSRLPNTSYGTDCLYQRLLQAKAKICGIGAGLDESPFLHYAEVALGVPYRYNKLFTGVVVESGNRRKQGWVLSVPVRAENGAQNRIHLEGTARSEGRSRVARVGMGEVASVSCESIYELMSREIARDPWMTAWGAAADTVELENARTSGRITDIRLGENASMEELISALWRLPRDIVSDGYDVALEALSTQVPMTIHRYPTGTECWTWLVPEKWTCYEGWLETLGGRRLFSYEENPLHVVSYSLPIEREVSREELLEHLHVHSRIPDAIPFIFKYYERDWGLCCSKNLKDSLQDDRYRVVIRSHFSYGTLKVGEVVAPGKSSKTFVLCAHLCHPAMVNDDLSGVVVGMKVMQELLKRQDLYYTYRFLILPETIGSVAFLSHHQNLVPDMIGGLFLEMLGLENPHALQLSFKGDTDVDRGLCQVLQEVDPHGWTGPFRTVVGNDERQFNAPGVRVPMLSLSRVMAKTTANYAYYPEYHSSHDTPELASSTRLAESRDLVLKMTERVEGNRVPVNRYQGEIFCSRYGLNIDAYANADGNRAFFDIVFLIDGTRSVAEIARVCGVPLQSVDHVVEDLRERGLVEYAGS
jgi:aminopeptidase-like protein/aminoglycoside N3'-acetyltransferase